MNFKELLLKLFSLYCGYDQAIFLKKSLLQFLAAEMKLASYQLIN